MAAMAGNQAGHKKTTTNLHPNLQFQKYRNCASDGGCNHTASITVMAGDWLLMNGKVTRSGQQKRSYPKSFARLILILSLREQTHIPHSPFFIGLFLLPSLSDSLTFLLLSTLLLPLPPPFCRVAIPYKDQQIIMANIMLNSMPKSSITRLGPNTVAADKWEMEKLNFWGFMRFFGGILDVFEQTFLTNFGEIGSLWDDDLKIP